jgi:tetratricopeptide (TPR) repeat protein
MPVKTFSRLVACALLVALAVVWADAGALARGSTPADAKALEQARDRMEKGQQLFAQGRYAQAMAEFEAAYEVAPYGAFLYNAAFAAEKAHDRQRAIARYQQFLKVDPRAPDAAAIRQTIARLERELREAPPVPDAGLPADGGVGPDVGAAAKPPVPADAKTIAEVRSLVFIESEPPGAPLAIYERTVPTASPFSATGPNTGWRQIVADAQTPRDLSLKVGHYHVVIDAFEDYKRSETDINLAPGHVYTFKANLSQGEFLGLLEVKSKTEGARIYVDDPPPHKLGPWGRTPHRALVGAGQHELWVEKNGFEPYHTEVDVKHGDTATVVAELERVSYGFLVIDGNADEIEVEIDEQSYGSWQAGQKPLMLKLPAGPHQLELDASGRNAYEGTIEVPRGQQVAVHGTLIESKGWGQAIGLAVAAAGATVGGVLFWQHAQSRKDDGEDDHETYWWLGTGMFIGGSVFGAASTFFFIYDPTDDSLVKQSDPRDLPDKEPPARAAHGPRAVGIGVAGAF